MYDSVTSKTVACQVPLSIGFSRQEYWSELPFPSPGDRPDPGTKLESAALAGGSSTAEPPGRPIHADRRQHSMTKGSLESMAQELI